MAVLILLLVVATGAMIYGRKATLLGSMPALFLGLAFANTSIGSGVLRFLTSLVDMALSVTGKISS